MLHTYRHTDRQTDRHTDRHTDPLTKWVVEELSLLKIGPEICETQPCICIISWDIRQKEAN